jgi:hypothetical protein
VDWYGDGAEALAGVDGAVSAVVEDSGLRAFLGRQAIDIDYELPAWAVIQDVAAEVDVFVRGPVSVGVFDFQDPSSGADLAPAPIGMRPLLVGFRPFSGGGYVLYATFHHHLDPAPAMLDTLYYLIFQL